MATKSGTDLRVYHGAEALGRATECTWSVDMETTSVIHKDSTGNFAENDPSTLSWSASCTGFISEDTTVNGNTVVDQTALQDAILNRTLLTLKWTTGTSTERFLTGTAYITSYQETGTVNETATYSIQYTGAGALTSGTEA